MKHCPKCNLDLPETDFFKRGTRPGLQSTCKRCDADRIRQIRAKQQPTGYKLCSCGCGTTIRAYDKYGVPLRFVNGHHRKTSTINEVLQYIKGAGQRTRFEIEMCCHLGKKEAGKILEILSWSGEIYQLGRGDWAAKSPYHPRRIA
jgi:hypothetical protein